MPTLNKRQIELLRLIGKWARTVYDLVDPHKKFERKGRIWTRKTAKKDLSTLHEQGLTTTTTDGRRKLSDLTADGKKWDQILESTNGRVAIHVPTDKHCLMIEAIRVMPGNKMVEVMGVKAGAPSLSAFLPEGGKLYVDVTTAGTLFVTPGSARIYYGSLGP